MNKFITEDKTGPEVPWVLLCGPTCIGKTHFRRVHNFYETLHRNPEFEGVPKSLWKTPPLYHHNLVTTSDFRLWPTDWYTEEFKIKKRAIVLGVPFFVWQERIKARGGDELPEGFMVRYHKKYTRWITRLKKYNIPYILVDNRNDFPILDESSFFTMLYEKKEEAE